MTLDSKMQLSATSWHRGAILDGSRPGFGPIGSRLSTVCPVNNPSGPSLK